MAQVATQTAMNKRRLRRWRRETSFFWNYLRKTVKDRVVDVKHVWQDPVPVQATSGFLLSLVGFLYVLYSLAVLGHESITVFDPYELETGAFWVFIIGLFMLLTSPYPRKTSFLVASGLSVVSWFWIGGYSLSMGWRLEGVMDEIAVLAGILNIGLGLLGIWTAYMHFRLKSRYNGDFG